MSECFPGFEQELSRLDNVSNAHGHNRVPICGRVLNGDPMIPSLKLYH